MQAGDVVELVVGLIALLFGGLSWLYRRRRGLPTSLTTPSSRPLPRSTEAPLRKALQRPNFLVVLATLVSVLLTAFVASIWISFRSPIFSPIQKTMENLMAFYLCIGAPLIAALAVLFTSALNTLFSEFQGKSLPRSLRAVIGAILGFVLTIPAFLFVSDK
jgi:magnesium-transporting ATPase (P-type)